MMKKPPKKRKRYSHYWKKPFGKCAPKHALPQDMFSIEGFAEAQSELDKL